MSKSRDEPSGLLSLPDELLIEVLENPKFPAEYLCILSVLCRRLHFLALPIFFRRHGVPEPSKSAVIKLTQNGADMLAALNMALFLTTVQDLTCILPHPSCSSILPLIPHVNRLKHFVSRFPSVRRVTLQLDAQNSMCNSVGDDAALRGWSSALGSLLTTLVERNCRELTVLYGGYLTRTFALQATQPPKRLVRTISNLKRFLFKGKPRLTIHGFEFQRAPSQGHERIFTSVIPRSSKLTTLHIHSAVLVTPPCLSWTISVLRSSPITSISLAHITLERGSWGPTLMLLAKAAGHSLASISLCQLGHISDEDVLGFLGRLPRLRSLEIGNLMEANGVWTTWNAHVPRLRCLTSLIAPPEFAIHLLRARKPARVTELCMALQGGPNKTHIRALATQVAQIRHTLESRATVTRICVALTLFSSEIIFDLDALPTLSSDIKESLACVSSLNLEVFPHSGSDVARWVSEIFPSGSIQEVSLAVRSASSNTEFVRAFARSNVKKLVVNGQGYDLTNMKL